jgi:hypothetical protein
MNPFPEEIIFVLIFGAVLLFQALRARWRRQHGRTSGEREPASDEEVETETVPPPAPRTPVLAEGPRRAATPKTRKPPAPAPQPLRRFSRRSLMGNRRAVQDAVVIAAILRPCHAKRPHEVE